MNLTRRHFIKHITASGFLLATTSSTALLATDKQDKTVLYSAGMSQNGQYFVSAVSTNGKQLFNTKLPARAHAVSIRPKQNQLIVFARRPRHFLWVLDAKTGRVIQKIQSAENRPLYGHGVFSADGNTLYLTANDIDNKHGVIMVLDATDSYRKVGEFSSGGIGPHELHFLSDDKTLVVANGGILTHPESGRAKLNLESMMPALSYLDTQQGTVIDDYQLASQYHQLSIRHLDVNQDDTVCFAMQHQGSRREQYPLVGFHHGQAELQLTKAPKNILAQMKNYCGSVTVDSSGRSFAVSSPKGNLVTTWSDQGEFTGSQVLDDGCGIATASINNSFYLSNGSGEIHHYKNTNKQDDLIVSVKNYRWDNHLLSHRFS